MGDGRENEDTVEIWVVQDTLPEVRLVLGKKEACWKLQLKVTKLVKLEYQQKETP